MPDVAPEPSPARGVTLAWRIAAVVAVLSALALLLARLVDPDFAWLPFGDRDLFRAADLGANPQVEGAEISNGSGARVPGGALYGLLWVIEALGPQPTAVWRTTVLLDAGATVLVGLVVAGTFGRVAGALAVGLLGTSAAIASTLTTLWNPSLLPPLVAIVWVGLVRTTRDRRASTVPAMLLAGAAASQVHLSALPLTIAATIGVVAARPVGGAAALGLGLALAVSGYLPWLLVDAGEGFPRAQAVLHAGAVSGGAHQTWGASARGVLGFVGGALPPEVSTRTLPTPWRTTLIVLVRAVDAAIVLGLATLLVDRTRRRLIATIAGVVAVVVAVALLGAVDWTRPGTGRHLVVAAPGIALLAAAGLRSAGRRLPPAASIGLAAIVAIGLPARAVSLILAHGEQSTGPLAWGGLHDRIEAVRATTGWDATALAGRTIFVPPGASATTWRASVPWAYPALLEGATLPGPLPGPCVAVLLPGEEPPREDAARIAAIFGDATTSGRSVTLADGTRIVPWQRPHAPCPTSFGDPWLQRPIDRLVEHATLPPIGAAAELDVGPGRAFLVPLPPTDGRPGPVLVVTLDGALDVTLDARGLRGDSAGFFPSGPVREGRLALAREGAAPTLQEDVPLFDVLGPSGLVTPLHVRAPVASGTWSAVLHVADPRGGDLAIPLTDALVVTPPSRSHSP